MRPVHLRQIIADYYAGATQASETIDSLLCDLDVLLQRNDPAAFAALLHTNLGRFDTAAAATAKVWEEAGSGRDTHVSSKTNTG